jgi:hypothetical protein
MSKAKAIGTRAETAVRNYLLSAGYDELEAHRNVLTGSDDQGDVWLREPEHGLMVFELKGGNMAKNGSYEQCKKWFAESQREAKNAGANFGFLVTQRAGVGYPRAGQWWAYASLGDLLTLRSGVRTSDSTFVRLTLQDLVALFNG